jgi:hypothetical protein
MRLTRTPADTLQNRLPEVAHDRSIVKLKEGRMDPRALLSLSIIFTALGRIQTLCLLFLDYVVPCIAPGPVSWID